MPKNATFNLEIMLTPKTNDLLISIYNIINVINLLKQPMHVLEIELQILNF